MSIDLNSMQMKLTKVMGKVAGNKLLLSMRDTFIMAATPIMIAGFATMLSSVFLDPAGIILGEGGLNLGPMLCGGVEAWQASGAFAVIESIREAVSLFSQGTMSINALLIVAGFAYFGTKRFFRKNKEPFLVVLYALAAFFISVPWNFTTTGADGAEVAISGFVNSGFLGPQGVFTGLICAGVTLFVYNKLVQKNIVIKLPASVPPAVAHSFESLIPGTVSLAIFVVVASVLKANGTSMPEFILSILQQPALALASTPFFAFAAITTQPLLQWFGIHGSSVWSPIFGVTWNINDVENMTGAAQHIYSTLFMNFSVVASGALTLAPIIAVLLISKLSEQKAIAKLAIAPGIFNVSEPVTYGFPIVLNPVLLAPYLLSWVVAFFLGAFLTELGIIPVICNNVPWTVPPILSGFLYSGSIMGALYQVVVIAITVLLYMPFLKINNALNAPKDADADEGAGKEPKKVAAAS